MEIFCDRIDFLNKKSFLEYDAIFAFRLSGTQDTNDERLLLENE